MGDVALATMANANSQAAGFIGKGVVVKGDTFAFEGGKGEKLGFELDRKAETVTVEVKDSKGNLIDTIETTGKEGVNDLTWDGIKSTAEDGTVTYYEDGEYTFDVTATDADGDEVGVLESTVVTRVESVKFLDQVPYLVLGTGETVTMNAVREFTNTDSK